MADRAEAQYAAIVGERELEAGVVTLGKLRTGSSGRSPRRLSEAVAPNRRSVAEEAKGEREYLPDLDAHPCVRGADDRACGHGLILCGWAASRRDHGGVTFVDLRDREEIVQVVFDPENAADAHAAAQRLSAEDVVGETGTVRARPEGMANPQLPTGRSRSPRRPWRSCRRPRRPPSRSRTASRPARSFVSATAISTSAGPR